MGNFHLTSPKVTKASTKLRHLKTVLADFRIKLALIQIHPAISTSLTFMPLLRML